MSESSDVLDKLGYGLTPDPNNPDLPKLLRALANSEHAKEYKHYIILEAAAKRIEELESLVYTLVITYEETVLFDKNHLRDRVYEARVKIAHLLEGKHESGS